MSAAEEERPEGAERGEAAGRPAKEQTILSMDRRTFCTGVAGAAVMLGLGGVKLAGAETRMRPPGGQDEDRLLAKCIRCQKCLTICPNNVILPGHLEDGLLSMRTPTLTFDASYCDWCAEANNGVPQCVQVCSTGALSLPEGATRETLVMGKASITTGWCLGHRLTGCKFCYLACEFGAIELDSFNRPMVIEDKCVGCGACESVCVSLQEGSIQEGQSHRAIIVTPVQAV